MPLVQTADLRPNELRSDTLQVYCGLDTMLTMEVLDEVSKLSGSGFANTPNVIYNFERALQGPVLEIMLRGFRVDESRRRAAMADLTAKIVRLSHVLNEQARVVWDRELNPRSNKQLKEFFYGVMRLPEQWISDKGNRRLSFRRDVLEKLEIYFYARPIIAAILAVRDNAKLLEIISTEVGLDGRMHTSYNIAGTETGRWSSSADAFGAGGNLQNIPPRLRAMFIADEEWKLCVIDLEQAESRELGFLCGVLFNDWSYLDACESGDLHTEVAKLIWTGLKWTGSRAQDRKLADALFYRDFSYRDMAKRGGHASNYYGTPWTIARHLKVVVGLIESFQAAYFQAFPCIPRFHQHTAQELQLHQSLVSTFGRERHFFGRPRDDSTLREAIAYQGQSPTADRTNLGLYRHWKTFGVRTNLLAQTHDSITFQYRPKDEAEIIPQALELMRVRMRAPNGREFVIPGEAKIGWNWGNFNEDPKFGALNLDGLKKWRGPGVDKRERTALLSRVI